jgi:hypothetical protein
MSEIFLFLTITCLTLIGLWSIVYTFVSIFEIVKYKGENNDLFEDMIELNRKVLNWTLSLGVLFLLLYMATVSGDCEKSIKECADAHARLTISNWLKLLHLNVQ